MGRLVLIMFFLILPTHVLAENEVRSYIGFGLTGKLSSYTDGHARDTKFSDFFEGTDFVDDFEAIDDVEHDDSVFGFQVSTGFRREKTGVELACDYTYRDDYNAEINNIIAETNSETKFCVAEGKLYVKINYKWELVFGAGIGYSVTETELLSLKYEAADREYKVDTKAKSTYKNLVWHASIGFERHLFRNWYAQGEFGWYDFGTIRLEDGPISIRANRTSPAFYLGIKRYNESARYAQTASNWITSFKEFMQRRASIELYGYTRHDPNGSGGYRTKDGKRHRWNNRNFGLGMAIDLYEPFDGLFSFRYVMGNFRNSYRRDAWYYGLEAAANLPVGKLPLVPNCARVSYGVRGAYVSGYDQTQLRANKYQRAGFQFYELGCSRVTFRMTCLFDDCTNIRTYSMTYALGPRRRT